jgi:hypothetical protein
MKREFLQNIQVEGHPLPKEVIDAIMAENGRDIENAKGAYANYESLLSEKQALENEFENVRLAHQKELHDLKLQQLLTASIHAQRGRSEKAITALLDMQSIQESEDMVGAVETAVKELKESHPYLFDASQVSPPYARGTGANAPQEDAPMSLAGALKERFFGERK